MITVGREDFRIQPYEVLEALMQMFGRGVVSG
jgi:hypothetical protein